MDFNGFLTTFNSRPIWPLAVTTKDAAPAPKSSADAEEVSLNQSFAFFTCWLVLAAIYNSNNMSLIHCLLRVFAMHLYYTANCQVPDEVTTTAG